MQGIEEAEHKNRVIKDVRSGIVQEAFYVAILAGGSVKLLLIDNDSLKKTFLNKGVQHPKN
jgi:hypothetical protein